MANQDARLGDGGGRLWWLALGVALLGACGGGLTLNCDGPCQCTSNAQCSGGKPLCDLNTGHCEACLPTSDKCGKGQRCVYQASAYVCQASCLDSSDCGTASSGSALSCCSASCVDQTSDIGNCGGCGLVCSVPPNGSPGCSSGFCGLAGCTAGFADCDKNDANGCEVHSAVDAMNCGACGTVCMAQAHQSTSCVDGKCAPVCDATWGDCDADPSNGCEAATQFDANNCGSCGHKCVGQTAYCQVGVCSQVPPASCKGILAGAPNSPSGVYTIAPDGKTGVTVYCDMVTDGGGWTVVSINGDLVAEGCQFRLKNDAPACGDPAKPDPTTDWQLAGNLQDLIQFNEVLLSAYTDPTKFYAATRLAVAKARTVGDGVMTVTATAVANAPISCSDPVDSRTFVNVDPFGFTLWGNDPGMGGCMNGQSNGLGLDASSGMGTVHTGWDDLQDGCGCGDSFMPADIGSCRGSFALR